MMLSYTTNHTSPINISYFITLISGYFTAIFLANFLDHYQINIGLLHTGLGSLFFPLTYLCIDAITELFGYKSARKIIWLGVGLFCLVSLSVVYFKTYSNYYVTQVSMNINIIAASASSLLLTDNINCYIISILQKYRKTRNFSTRCAMSSILAYLINEIIYAPIAYQSSQSEPQIIQHVLSSWLFMVGLQLLFTPLFVALVTNAKQQFNSTLLKTNIRPSYVS